MPRLAESADALPYVDPHQGRLGLRPGAVQLRRLAKARNR